MGLTVQRVVGVVTFVAVLAFGGHWLAERQAVANPQCVADVQAELGLSDQQVTNAAIIAAVGRDMDMDMPDRAVVVALATAMQESNLHDTTRHPPGEDSAGLFQQRPSQGWGTYSQVMDPEHAATSFYEHLRKVDGWQDMRVTDAAQAVQRSAYREAYQKWADDAKMLTAALLDCGKH